MTIKEIRKAEGLSQSQFAKKYGIPLTTLQHWEQGFRNPPEYVISLISTITRQNKEIEALKALIK